jgi:hypothetical protein
VSVAVTGVALAVLRDGEGDVHGASPLRSGCRRSGWAAPGAGASRSGSAGPSRSRRLRKAAWSRRAARDLASAVEEIRIRSWAELNHALYHGSWRADLVRLPLPARVPRLPRRGVPLHTRLHRFAADAEAPRAAPPRELPEVRITTPSAMNRCGAWLALAQHHGLPTRLLD